MHPKIPVDARWRIQAENYWMKCFERSLDFSGYWMRSTFGIEWSIQEDGATGSIAKSDVRTKCETSDDTAILLETFDRNYSCPFRSTVR
jgi:hypothetical protein